MKLQFTHPMIRFWHYIGEFLATFLFTLTGSIIIGVFFGLHSLQGEFLSPETRLLIVVILVVSTSLIVVYSPLGKISGAHMNSAVSFSFWMEAHLDTIDLIFYILMQISAAILATYIAFWIIPEPAIATKLGLPQPSSDHRIFIEFAAEILGTGILISLLFFFLSEQLLVKYTGFLVGCYIFFVKLISLEGVSVTLNPAKFLSAGTVFHEFHLAWIYIAGPMIGAFLAVLLHRSWNILKRPKYFRLNHQEGYLEKLFKRYSDLKIK